MSRTSQRRVPVPAHQHLESVHRRVDEVSAAFDAVGEGLTPTQLRWRPEPGAWSIAHCLEHLITTTELYDPSMLEGIENSGRRRAPEGGGTYKAGWLVDWFIRAVGPAGQRRLKAPKRFQPAPEVPGRVRERFAATQGAMRRWIEGAHEVDLDKSRVKLPELPMIKISVGEALEFLVEHQRRHLEQARRVRQNPDFPVSVFDG